MPVKIQIRTTSCPTFFHGKRFVRRVGLVQLPVSRDCDSQSKIGCILPLPGQHFSYDLMITNFRITNCQEMRFKNRLCQNLEIGYGKIQPIFDWLSRSRDTGN